GRGREWNISLVLGNRWLNNRPIHEGKQFHCVCSATHYRFKSTDPEPCSFRGIVRGQFDSPEQPAVLERLHRFELLLWDKAYANLFCGEHCRTSRKGGA